MERLRNTMAEIHTNMYMYMYTERPIKYFV